MQGQGQGAGGGTLVRRNRRVQKIWSWSQRALPPFTQRSLYSTHTGMESRGENAKQDPRCRSTYLEPQNLGGRETQPSRVQGQSKLPRKILSQKLRNRAGDRVQW